MNELNHERLLRAIRCLQLIQRTNAPKSTIFKAASKALAPLMDEQATMPPPHSTRQSRAKLASQQVGERAGNATLPMAGNHDPQYAGQLEQQNTGSAEQANESLPGEGSV